jgi:hypothetical protein
MTLTADNITDAKIRELRDALDDARDEHIHAEYNGELGVWSVGVTLSNGLYVGCGCATENVVPSAKVQVRATCAELAIDCAVALDAPLGSLRRIQARARCAEFFNVRAEPEEPVRIMPGQICRDRTCSTFKIVIVLEPSKKSGKFRVCRWQSSPNPSIVDGRWSAPCAVFEHQLEALPADFDLTSKRGQVVSAAKRSIVNGLVRWQVGPSFSGDKLTEVHHVGTVRP